MAIAVGQFTITDFNDINISKTAPTRPILDQLWLDSSVVPNQLKRWDGTKWVVVNDTSKIEKAVKDADDKAKGVLDTVTELKAGSNETSIYNIIKETKTVDGKPYFARTADITTTIDNWTAKFGSIGGRNLLYASNVEASASSYWITSYIMEEEWQPNTEYTVTIKGSLKGTGVRQ